MGRLAKMHQVTCC